jgi:predicted neutral ceramidase superfamily lipid hydrolase
MTYAAGKSDERAAPDGRKETEMERLDRNMIELLNELRVALPGVQVLFAFLLTVPFNQRFGQVTDFQRDVYFATLMCTAVATALLLAPSALHRIEFRQGDKKYIVLTSNRYAIAGFAFLLLAVTGAVLLITDFLFGPTTTIVTTAFIAVLLALLWYVLPFARRAKVRKRYRSASRST